MVVVVVAAGAGKAVRNRTVSWALPPPSAFHVVWQAGWGDTTGGAGSYPEKRQRSGTCEISGVTEGIRCSLVQQQQQQ